VTPQLVLVIAAVKQAIEQAGRSATLTARAYEERERRTAAENFMLMIARLIERDSSDGFGLGKWRGIRCVGVEI